MTWRILDPFDGCDLPDATVPLYWRKSDLHGALFIADIGEGDDQFIAFRLADGQTAKLLSFDLYQDSDGDDTVLAWEGAETNA